MRIAEVEPCARVFAFGCFSCRVNRVILPNGTALKGLIEVPGDIDLVLRGRRAKAARRGSAGVAVVPIELNAIEKGEILWLLLGQRCIGAGACIDEQSSRNPLREDEASDACTIGNSDLDANAVGQRNGVVAGMGFFACVIEVC